MGQLVPSETSRSVSRRPPWRTSGSAACRWVEDKKLVGMTSEADIARHLPDEQVAGFAERICAA